MYDDFINFAGGVRVKDKFEIPKRIMQIIFLLSMTVKLS